MARRVNVPSDPRRVVLSEVLPYEVSPYFSNRALFRFLRAFDVSMDARGTVSWRRSDPATSEVIRLLVGAGKTTVSVSTDRKRHELLLGGKEYTIPFKFDVAKNERDTRQLSIPHPRNQLAMVEFYRKNAAGLLHATDRSHFSIRRPVRVGTHSFFKDRLHDEVNEAWGGLIAENRREYESFRSYFSYERYSNIYKFFESRLYQSLERRFSHRMKLDVSRCFESIYTHSISWALYGKAPIKESINKTRTFLDDFDSVMQKLNYNETNGIIVGPEFSRIFAEIILQGADVEAERALRLKGLSRGTDYEILRYVDDYFIFYNVEDTGESIRTELTLSLRQYNLSLNQMKEELARTPDISPISVAKTRISRLLSEHSVFEPTFALDIPLLSARSLITAYKTILRDTGAAESDVLNYTLAIVETALAVSLVHLAKASPTAANYREVVHNLVSMLEFAFFAYSSSPRVNPTVKLCRVIGHITLFSERAPLTPSTQSRLLDTIYVGLREQLDKSSREDHVHVEKLYLLSALSSLGRDYLIPQESLLALFGVRRAGSNLRFERSLDYFALTSLLQYTQRRKRYKQIREAAQQEWLERATRLHPRSTERVLLVLDGITCPYIEQSVKNDLLTLVNVHDPALRGRMINQTGRWFMKWRRFDIREELELKRNQEVY